MTRPKPKLILSCRRYPYDDFLTRTAGQAAAKRSVPRISERFLRGRARPASRRWRELRNRSEVPAICVNDASSKYRTRIAFDDPGPLCLPGFSRGDSLPCAARGLIPGSACGGECRADMKKKSETVLCGMKRAPIMIGAPCAAASPSMERASVGRRQPCDDAAEPESAAPSAPSGWIVTRISCGNSARAATDLSRISQ